MNLRLLVRPALYGGTAGVVVAALGFLLADWQSVSLYLTAAVYLLVGTSMVGLLLGASSFNENSESADTLGDGDNLLSAPTEAGPERRLTMACFGATLVVSGFAAGFLLG